MRSYECCFLSFSALAAAAATADAAADASERAHSESRGTKTSAEGLSISSSWPASTLSANRTTRKARADECDDHENGR